jgi:hypothetical protein
MMRHWIVGAAVLASVTLALTACTSEKPIPADAMAIANVREERAVDDCMVAAGYKDGAGFPPAYAASSQSDLQFALQRQVARQNCFAGVDVGKSSTDLSVGALDTAQRKDVYDYYVEWLVPCLVQHGFRLRTAPSEDQFVRSSRGQGWWTPYASLAVQMKSDEQLDWLEQECRPMPAEVK